MAKFLTRLGMTTELYKVTVELVSIKATKKEITN